MAKKAGKGGRKKKPGTPRKRRGVKLKPTELEAKDLRLEAPPPEVAGLVHDIEADGGAVLAVYREPLGGHPLVFAALPLSMVAPTPFQRDISDAHVRRLTHAMDKTRRFLDPVIAVREPRAGRSGDAELGNVDAHYWVPNGNHRMTALRELGAKTVPALVVPELRVAYQILALNIEKAHNLRERAIGVVRMVRDLSSVEAAVARGARAQEEDYALEFEEPALITLGLAYEQRGRLAGGSYHPILRKLDGWLPGPIPQAFEKRQALAAALVELDDAVNEAVAKLKARGFTSPYLKAFVVARINPLRFIKGEPPSLAALLPSMAKRARGMKVERIKPEDVVRSGGASADED